MAPLQNLEITTTWSLPGNNQHVTVINELLKSVYNIDKNDSMNLDQSIFQMLSKVKP